MASPTSSLSTSSGNTVTTLDGSYYVLVAALLVVVTVLYLVNQSRTGRAWRALREDELAAELMTMPVDRLKLMAFCVRRRRRGARRRALRSTAGRHLPVERRHPAADHRVRDGRARRSRKHLRRHLRRSPHQRIAGGAADARGRERPLLRGSRRSASPSCCGRGGASPRSPVRPSSSGSCSTRSPSRLEPSLTSTARPSAERGSTTSSRTGSSFPRTSSPATACRQGRSRGSSTSASWPLSSG